ncbi:hypothetical protein Gotur_024630 [Gossypium turneri]
MNKVFRICLYNKARNILPVDLFRKIDGAIETQYASFQKAFTEHFLQAYVFTNDLGEEFPTIKFRLDHEPFDITSIEWGFVKDIIVQNFSFHLLKDFPAIIKAVLQNIINNDDFYCYFHIEISSLIGIAEKERFYQPYQIWIIQKMIGNPQLSAVTEDKDHLATTIDHCNKFSSYYQIQFWTDGRRILACETGNNQIEKDEDSLRLLKKIAEMEIEDFPSYILEQIRSNWDAWNSLRSSFDSLHLDDIEEMNLNNMQEAMMEATMEANQKTSRCRQQSPAAWSLSSNQ